MSQNTTQQLNHISKQLYELYKKHWPKLESEMKKVDPIGLKISNLFLMDIFPEYLQSKIKLLVVGQQTNGWTDPSTLGYFNQNLGNDPIETLMKEYREVHLGEKYNSTIFKASRRLYKELNSTNYPHGYLWSNLVRVDEVGHRPKPEIEDIVCDSFPVLSYEIEILKPDAVIFFIGQDYDIRLEKTFKGLEKIKSDSEILIHRIKHEQLPENTFRTNHPESFRFRTGLYFKTIDTIVKLVLK